MVLRLEGGGAGVTPPAVYNLQRYNPRRSAGAASRPLARCNLDRNWVRNRATPSYRGGLRWVRPETPRRVRGGCGGVGWLRPQPQWRLRGGCGRLRGDFSVVAPVA